MRSVFWSAAGLKRLAELVEEEARAEGSSQKVIAQKSGVSEQTVSNFLLNRYNDDDRIVKEPKPDTLIRIAPHITDPDTGKPFDPEKFIAIARGIKPPKSQEIEVTPGADLPYPEAVRHLKELIGDRSIEQAAKDWQIPPERLEELLTTTNPIRAVPNGIEVHRISQSYPDKLGNRLTQFYAEPHAEASQSAGNGRKRLSKHTG